MKKLIHITKTYDYGTKEQAKRDIPKMREKGFIVYEEYQAEATYVVEYAKDLLYKQKG